MQKVKKRKPGGQTGNKGSRLEPVESPSVIEVIEIDRRTLPAGNWESAGFDKRQVIDIEVSFIVTEYQAEVLMSCVMLTIFGSLKEPMSLRGKNGRRR